MRHGHLRTGLVPHYSSLSSLGKSPPPPQAHRPNTLPVITPRALGPCSQGVQTMVAVAFSSMELLPYPLARRYLSWRPGLPTLQGPELMDVRSEWRQGQPLLLPPLLPCHAASSILGYSTAEFSVLMHILHPENGTPSPSQCYLQAGVWAELLKAFAAFCEADPLDGSEQDTSNGAQACGPPSLWSGHPGQVLFCVGFLSCESDIPEGSISWEWACLNIFATLSYFLESLASASLYK